MIIIPEAVSKDVIERCNKEIDSRISSNTWGINQRWGSELYDGIPGSCLIGDLSSEVYLIVRRQLRKHLPECGRMDFMYHYWTKHSGINWHDDGGYIFGATLYLNEWNKEWGGIFLWEDNGMQAFCPTVGTFVLNTEGQMHSVTHVHERAPYARRSIQIFGHKK